MEPPRRAAPLLPARAPGTCGIAERAPAALWSRRRGGGLPRLVGNDLCLGLELTAHEFRCPSSLRLPPTRTAERLAETAGSALPLADSGGRSAARGAHARTARWKEPIPPTSALGLFASKSVRPDQKSVKNFFSQIATKTSLARTLGAAAQMGRAGRVSQGLSLSRPMPQSQRGDGGHNRSRCRGRRPAPRRFSPKGGEGTRRRAADLCTPS